MYRTKAIYQLSDLKQSSWKILRLFEIYRQSGSQAPVCDLHHTSIISIQEPSKRKKNIFVYFCLFLSVNFVNILPKSGGEQTLIELDPPPPVLVMELWYLPTKGLI